MYRLGVVAIRSNEYPLLATQYQIHECISFWVFRCFYIINDFVFGLSTNLFEDAANPHDFPLNRCNCAELILLIQFAFLLTHTRTHTKPHGYWYKKLVLISLRIAFFRQFFMNCARFARVRSFFFFRKIQKR